MRNAEWPRQVGFIEIVSLAICLFAAVAPTARLRTKADDCLPAAPFGRIEGGDGFVEARDNTDVRSQSSVPHPLDDLSQLGAIGLDNEVDCETVDGPLLY